MVRATDERLPGHSVRTWRGLLRLILIVEAGLFAIVGVAFHDRETLVFAVLLALCTVAVRFRKGTLGAAASVLLFADIVFWTLPGAVSNLAHRDDLVAVMIPATLAIVAITGIFAAVITLGRGRSDTGTAGRGSLTLLAIAAGTVLVVGVVTIALTAGHDRGPRPGDLVVRTSNMRFTRERLATPATTSAVYVENRDLFWHTFTVRGLDVDVKVPGRGARRLEFDAPPGRYEFYCAIPGHEQAGMQGVLTIR